MDQSAEVQMNHGDTRHIKTERAVRQGCCLSLILFNLYSKYLSTEAPDGLGDFKIGQQVICTVKYVDDLTLLARDGIILQVMTDAVVKVIRWYAMKTNVEKN
jgi:hypothetical protein